jgi:hypothetical protein
VIRAVANALWRPVAWLVTRPGIKRRILQRAARTPYTDIYADDKLYMRRWWLFNPYPGESTGDGLPRFRWLPSVRVHHIVRPDRDRNLHDHPWSARTIILDGWYVEKRDDRRAYLRSPGDTASIRHNEFHTITAVDKAHGAVTLFITWGYRHTWGFKVPYREYLEGTGAEVRRG